MSLDLMFPHTSDDTYEGTLTSALPIGGWTDSRDSTAVETNIPEGKIWDDDQNPVKDLFELCADLARDPERREKRDPCLSPAYLAGVSGSLVQRLLCRTSKLSDILSRMAGDEESQATHDTVDQEQSCAQSLTLPDTEYSPSMAFTVPASNHPSRPSQIEEHAHISASACQRKVQDITITATLASAYILVIRAWNDAFGIIHQLQLGSAREGTSRGLALPSLNLGGFQIQNNPDIQIIVLLEFCTTMVRTIEAFMGVASSAVPAIPQMA
ncbi:hypothetical protein GGR54DRAFT_579258 [Hypoxylon sp. NC1633]|nr:hypothetical protein GGR54DRAFT_579258 [Hypoxylon sp. NC1633]